MERFFSKNKKLRVCNLYYILDIKPEQILLVGDSAGGNLLLGVT